jgi:amino acid transporter
VAKDLKKSQQSAAAKPDPKTTVSVKPDLVLSSGAYMVSTTELRQESVTYNSVLEPPQVIEEYSKLVPDAPALYFKSFIGESEHRRALEQAESDRLDRIVDARMGTANRGQWFAFILAMVLIGAAVWLAISGHDGVASVIFGTTIVGLVATFITGRLTERKSESKDEKS